MNNILNTSTVFVVKGLKQFSVFIQKKTVAICITTVFVRFSNIYSNIFLTLEKKSRDAELPGFTLLD